MATDAASNSISAAPAGGASLAKYKLVFLGDQAVGKTSIITRFWNSCTFSHSKILIYLIYFIGLCMIHSTPLIKPPSASTFYQKLCTSKIVPCGYNFGIQVNLFSILFIRLRLMFLISLAAGQERFRSLIPSYIRDSSVAVIVYDITSKHLLKNFFRL